jgi:N-acetylmuramoyl-L-alanine amidase
VRVLTILALCLFTGLPFSAEEKTALNYMRPESAKIKTVVIDAGHGGKDSGSLGSLSKEKDIALKIALKLGEYINTYIPNVKVVYTRKTDKFVPLYERAELANKYDADVFISVHCNSLPPRKKYIQGTETYVMGLHTAEANLQVAKRENNVILLEEDYSKRYDGFDPNSPEAHIMLSMYQNAFLGQSILLAEKVESQFKNRAKRNSRGVKQAGFVVLKATSMPSVLIETGFLSNKTEEAYLRSEKGQAYIASAIYRAFKEYRDAIEDVNNQQQLNLVPQHTKAAPQNLSNEVVFKVQLASSPVKLNTASGRFGKVDNIEEFQIAGAYKYVTGSYNSMAEAIKGQRYWRQNGFADAFVVAFQDGKRISVAKAKALLGD